MASKAKILESTISEIYRNYTRVLFGSFKGLSKANKTDYAAIRKRINMSKV
jgi:hypothetical protein